MFLDLEGKWVSRVVQRQAFIGCPAKLRWNQTKESGIRREGHMRLDVDLVNLSATSLSCVSISVEAHTNWIMQVVWWTWKNQCFKTKIRSKYGSFWNISVIDDMLWTLINICSGKLEISVRDSIVTSTGKRVKKQILVFKRSFINTVFTTVVVSYYLRTTVIIME